MGNFVCGSNGLLARFTIARLYIRLSSDDNGHINRASSVITKSPLLIGSLFGILLMMLLTTPVGLVLFMKLSTNHSTTPVRTTSHISMTTTTTTTTTTVLSHLSTRTTTTSSKFCPIPAVNAIWSPVGNVIVNPTGKCLSDENGICSARDFFLDNIHNTLYIADTDNNRIQKYSLTESYYQSEGAIGVTVAKNGLLCPQSVFVDTQTETMYIMDFDKIKTYTQSVSYRVHLWKKNETVGRILFSETMEKGFSPYIQHLTLDNQMNIYVATRSFILKWLASTKYTGRVIVAGKDGNSSPLLTSLRDPAGFFITDDLTLYIADWNNKRIQQWKVNATVGEIVIEFLGSVLGITMDCNGYIYFFDGSGNKICQIDMVEGRSREIIGRINTDKDGWLISTGPGMIQIDKFGNIYILGNQRVYRFLLV